MILHLILAKRPRNDREDRISKAGKWKVINVGADITEIEGGRQ
jgi:hypothetical protein